MKKENIIKREHRENNKSGKENIKHSVKQHLASMPKRVRSKQANAITTDKSEENCSGNKVFTVHRSDPHHAKQDKSTSYYFLVESEQTFATNLDIKKTQEKELQHFETHET